MALGQYLWGLLNARDVVPPGAWQEGEFYDMGPVYRYAQFTWTASRQQAQFRNCETGEASWVQLPADTIGGSTGGGCTGFSFSGMSGAIAYTASGGVSSAVNAEVLLRQADGSTIPLYLTRTGGTASGNGPYGLCGERQVDVTASLVQFGGVSLEPPSSPRVPLPDSVRPEVPALEPLTVEPVLPLPAVAPAPAPAPEPLPQSVPVPVPARSPGGAPAPSRSPAPGGAPGQAPAPAPATAPDLPGALPIGPVLTPPAPIVAPPVVTPVDAVVLDGEIQGGPGLAPAPNLTAMAAELGRLERKGEMTLDRLKGLSALDDLATLLPSLLEFLGTIDGGTTYSIQPPCGTKANGDPLDPIEVIVPPTIGPENATIARLDALAMLIDEHKSIRQPICKGKPAGAPVTVTGVEVEP